MSVAAIERFQDFSFKVECDFNVSAAKPGLGILSSPLRIIVGLVQVIAGPILFGVAKLHLRCNPQLDDKKVELWTSLGLVGLSHACNGVGNVIRGTLEWASAVLTAGMATKFFNEQMPTSIAVKIKHSFTVDFVAYRPIIDYPTSL